MKRPWRKTWRRSLGRRACATVTLCAYLLTALGVPLPAAAARSTGATPYPCQEHRCGCVSAEQCWQSCCCMTPEERWAWARQKAIEPPPGAAKPATSSWQTTRLRDREKAENCCSSKSPGCPHHDTGRPESVKKPAKKPTPPAKPERPAPTPDHGWTLAFAALKCQGQSTLWVSTGVAIPGPLATAWRPNLTPVGWSRPTANAPIPLPVSPPDPPPRSHG